MSTYKTPGVYVELKRKLPVEIALLETALPAFIGYTQITEREGKTLLNIPIRIKSLAEYIDFFGSGPDEQDLDVTLDSTQGFKFLSFQPKSGENPAYFLYNSLRLYFDNGGGDCLVVSIGAFGDEIKLGGYGVNGLLSGLESLRKDQEATLILFPDAVHLSESNLGTLHQQSIRLCADLKDRFSIFDLRLTDELSEAVDSFRNFSGANDLKYGAAFAPWLQHAYIVPLTYRKLSFFDQNGESLDPLDMTSSANHTRLVLRMNRAISDTNIALESLEILTGSDERPEVFYSNLETALLAELNKPIPSNPFTKAKFREILDFAAGLVHLFPVWADPDPLSTSAFKTPDLLRKIEAIFGEGLDDSITLLISFWKNADVKAHIYGGILADLPDFSKYDEYTWLSAGVPEIPADTTDFGTGTPVYTVVQNAYNAFFSGEDSPFREVLASVAKILDTAWSLEKKEQETLYRDHPILSPVTEKLRFQLALTPPGGAIAGKIALTDRRVGPWRAPANIQLESVNGLSHYINQFEQAGLNVDPTGGKSINAIRPFGGRGILIYGSRTLAGNDSEWRYLPVRRLFISVEKAIRETMRFVTFEPNEDATWSNTRNLIDGYLYDLFIKGAFIGPAPSNSYYVKVGIGETMTSLDVLEGRMIVEVGLAVARPAEFIVLNFTFNMQELITNV